MKIKSLFIIACAMMFTLSLSAQTRKGTTTKRPTTASKRPAQQTASKPILVDLGLPSGGLIEILVQQALLLLVAIIRMVKQQPNRFIRQIHTHSSLTLRILQEQSMMLQQKSMARDGAFLPPNSGKNCLRAVPLTIW